MSDVLITRATASDQPQLHQLWHTVFGDPAEMILAFYDCFPPEVAAWAVRHNDTILSAAYLIPGNWYLDKTELRPAGYVYAVATAPDYRVKGYAGMLMRAISAEAKEREMLLYTRPAEQSLFPWYANTLSAAHTSRMSEIIVERDIDAKPFSCIRLSSEEYGARREQLLQYSPHIVLSDHFLKLQDFYSSGYFAVGDSICCCSIEEQSLLISEFIGRNEFCDSAAQTMLNHFGKERAVIRLEQPDGDHLSVAYCGLKERQDIHWGLFLE